MILICRSIYVSMIVQQAVKNYLPIYFRIIYCLDIFASRNTRKIINPLHPWVTKFIGIPTREMNVRSFFVNTWFIQNMIFVWKLNFGSNLAWFDIFYQTFKCLLHFVLYSRNDYLKVKYYFNILLNLSKSIRGKIFKKRNWLLVYIAKISLYNMKNVKLVMNYSFTKYLITLNQFSTRYWNKFDRIEIFSSNESLRILDPLQNDNRVIII